MIHFLALLTIGLPIYITTPDGDAEKLLRTIESFVEKAPCTITYHYTLSRDDFHQDTTGTLILLEPAVFRLSLWDKVYGSDGETLYLHDMNTRQTVIDSLRWTELHPWLQILNGELPHGTRIIRQPSNGRISKWLLTHFQPEWRCTVAVDTLANRFTEVKLIEGDWEHVIHLDIPSPYKTPDSAKLVSLYDLPGVRLDLR